MIAKRYQASLSLFFFFPGGTAQTLDTIKQPMPGIESAGAGVRPALWSLQGLWELAVAQLCILVPFNHSSRGGFSTHLPVSPFFFLTHHNSAVYSSSCQPVFLPNTSQFSSGKNSRNRNSTNGLEIQMWSDQHKMRTLSPLNLEMRFFILGP